MKRSVVDSVGGDRARKRVQLAVDQDTEDEPLDTGDDSSSSTVAEKIVWKAVALCLLSSVGMNFFF